MQTSPHTWRFFRSSGFYQVDLVTPSDLLALRQLDQKLWTALSCPTAGLELDARTVALLDADKDGRIRAPEILATIDWADALLKTPEDLMTGKDGIALTQIKDNTDDGKRIIAGMKTLLARLGKTESLTLADIDAAKVAADQDIPTSDANPLGKKTAAAHLALEAVRQKVDDYFTRARLIELDERGSVALNPQDAQLTAIGAAQIDDNNAAVAALPLAHIATGRPLPLRSGLNPAWTTRMLAFANDCVEPLLGPRDALSYADWQLISQKLAGHQAWLASQAAAVSDAGVFVEIEKLARIQRDLLRLLRSFVTFSDFYRGVDRALFQVGTLFIDQRSCELCVHVDDPSKHGALATTSQIFLAYCECVRRSTNEKRYIVAAITAGDGDNLFVGRNGLFYDRQGRDWDATIVKIVQHPISVRQAFFAPYRRVASLVQSQIEKLADARDKEVHAKSAATVSAPVPFDVAKFAGIFAAIGLALGAIGGAIATVVAAFVRLSWWQMPLALVGAMLAVSGPSMVMAWLKLRQRNIGPLLDASGWAVNSRARINIPFGATLSKLAKLPSGSQKNRLDPYATKSGMALGLVLAACVALGALAWYEGWIQRGLELLGLKG